MSIATEQPIFNTVTSIEDVAKRLGTSAKQLRFLLYARPEGERYTSFAISKRSGGSRAIKAPKGELKAIQRRLADFLQEKVHVRPAAHGFTRDRSIRTNAKLHVGHRTVLNIDLKDFFPTINFGRVRGLFLARPFGAIPDVATVLAQICCHENSLPQGAPTSPVISNMICSRMDGQLQRLASDHSCFYTRYADDMTFSKRKGAFPPELAYEKEDGNIAIADGLREIIKQNGFLIHPDKIHLYRNTARQSVTGLTVNSRVNVPRKFVRDIRAMIHDWRVNGEDAAQARHHAEFYRHRNRRGPKPSLRRIIEGKLNFLKMVRGVEVEDHVRKDLQRQLMGVYPEYQKVMDKEDKVHDFFISHAWEDKEDFVGPLVAALKGRGIRVWYDEYELKIGDSLSQKIEEGLASSRYGIVVLSHSFFDIKKTWPKIEVDAMFAAEDSYNRSVIKPIWYNVDQADVARNSQPLAERIAWKASDYTPEQLAGKFLAEVIKPPRK